MNIKSFYYKYHVDISDKFITRLEHWKNDAADIHVVKCQFNINEYNLSKYNYLKIHFPSELSLAVKKRQAEFLAGRFCAKACMQAMEVVVGIKTLPVGKNRAPIWPLGIVGSITHSDTEAICAIRKSGGNRCIGIDIEPVFSKINALQLGSQIHSNLELETLCKKNLKINIASTLIFSAKESLFKALHPSVGMYFGFEEAQIIDANILERYLIIRLKDSFASTHNLVSEYRCYFTLKDNKVITLVY